MSPPTTTIVPFASLPSCAANCGPLYDANGACVPPAAADSTETTYDKCFCAYSSLQGLKSNPPTDVCNGQCSADPAGYTSIHNWFTSLCNQVDAEATAGSSTSSSSSSGSTGGDWLSSHWRWVVMLVIIFVGIVAIWIGACLWRRHYLRRKDRIFELGKHTAARASGTGQWAPGSGVNVQYGNGINPVLPNGSVPPTNIPRPNPNPAMSAAVLEEEKEDANSTGKGKLKEKKKWVVEERT